MRDRKRQTHRHTLALAGALAALLACDRDDRRQADREADRDVAAADTAVEVVRDSIERGEFGARSAGEYGYEERGALRRDLARRLEEYDRRIAREESRLRNEGDPERLRALEHYRQVRSEVRSTLAGTGRATREDWERARAELDESWTRLQAAFDEVTRGFGAMGGRGPAGKAPDGR